MINLFIRPPVEGQGPAPPQPEATPPATHERPSVGPELTLSAMLVCPFLLVYSFCIVLYHLAYLLGILCVAQATAHAAQSRSGRFWNLWIALYALAFMLCGMLMAARRDPDGHLWMTGFTLILAWPAIWAIHQCVIWKLATARCP